MEFVNDIFADFATAFVSEDGAEAEGQGEIVYSDHLGRDRLDYSLESLKVVDAYLSHLHDNAPERGGPEWSRTILWGGAYVGEVIRRNAPRPYDWVDFEDFIAEYPQSTSMLGEETNLAVCAVLSTGNSGFTLPINKVLKFLANGAEDSVAFYATAECKER